MADAVLITCEHGGNRVPARYRQLFLALERPLQTHRGFDAGALQLARQMAAALRAPLVAATVTRLLVDLNRSVGNRSLHVPAVRARPADERARILADYYTPYRAQVEKFVQQAALRGRRMVHISAHSFTPVLDGKVRNADIGLLYDPARPGEASLCERWKATLRHAAPDLRVRRNYPYAGKNDGFTAHLRKRFPPQAYVGVEVEVNQGLVMGARSHWAQCRVALIESFRVALAPD